MLPMNADGAKGSETTLGRRATVPCPFCATLNRVDLGRVEDRPRCGSCKRPLLLDRPIAVTDATVDAVTTGGLSLENSRIGWAALRLLAPTAIWRR